VDRKSTSAAGGGSQETDRKSDSGEESQFAHNIPEHSGVIWHISPTPDVILPDPAGVVIGVGLYNPTEAVERHF